LLSKAIVRRAGEDAMAGNALTRRSLLAALGSAAFTGAATAQAAWPERPVRVLVPYPPAGGADTIARIIYAKLSEIFGQQFAVENRGGAGLVETPP
jgi:tripartite-type tricarboxylate transporter receptor subunit TctC